MTRYQSKVESCHPTPSHTLRLKTTDVKHRMVINSMPLFAYVTPGTPDDYIIDISSWTDPQKTCWGRSGFFADISSGKTRWTLTEFMNTGLKNHKILDYLEHTSIKERWVHLFKSIYETNPTLEKIQLHFYSDTFGIPYYLNFNRDENCLYLHEAYPFDIKHSPQIIKRSWIDWLSGIPTFHKFKPDLYAINFHTISYMKRDYPIFTDSSVELAYKLRNMYYSII